ncbi:Asp-box repeat domain-containing protein [Fusarium denticulatum]|uniref:Asp-box repeat domain-containing protein n=1 Tax=Fusarium denticulatum TaxID=48507 RepID=A0A8H5TNS3_9HYPO|nr:Asp-box repeat domain-containing protein [Fusarium denticulatum]
MFNFMLIFLAVVSSLSSLASASAITPRAPRPWSNFNNNVVFTPPKSWVDPRTLYARTLQLSDKSLLITCEIYSPEDPLSLPIFRFTDGGATWKEHSRFRDQFGGYPAGTILAVGTSLPSNKRHAYIDMYVSTDGAKTFKYLSHIAYGPGPETKLVHTTTTDLRKWTPIVDDVAMNYYGGRPGMTTAAHIPTNDNYIMTFKNCGAPVKNCQVNYIVSNDPKRFLGKPIQPIVSNDTASVSPYGSPFIIWAPRKAGSEDGILIANGNSDSNIYINDYRALPGNWKRVNINQKHVYSRDLRVINDNRGNLKLLVASGGNFGQAKTNALIVGVVDIPQ